MKRVGMSELGPVIRECIENGTEVKLAITGNSMNPLVVNERDSVVLKKADGLKKLDVPLYIRPNGQYVLHRIVRIKDGEFFLAGDAQTEIETGITETDCIAVAVGFYRKGRLVSCDSFGYRFYSRLWVFCLPVRKYIFKLYRIFTKFRRKP